MTESTAAGEHPLIFREEFEDLESFGLFLMHERDYEEAVRRVGAGALLDVGCNNGYGSAMLARSGADVVAIDTSPAAIHDAKRRFEGSGVDFRVVEGSRLPFADGAFDAVTSLQVIEHVDDAGAFLDEIARVLKPGGRAILTTPNREIRLDPGMAPWNPYHVTEFAPEELRALLERHFAKVELLGLFAKPELHERELRRCDAARRAARAHSPTASATSALKSAIKAVLPASAVRTIGRLRGTRPAPVAGGPFSKSHDGGISTVDYFYRSDGLEGSLSLFADCATRTP